MLGKRESLVYRVRKIIDDVILFCLGLVIGTRRVGFWLYFLGGNGVGGGLRGWRIKMKLRFF